MNVTKSKDNSSPPREFSPHRHLTLLKLPPEALTVIFEYLNPIDSACLGVTHSSVYEHHRRKHATVPLLRTASERKTKHCRMCGDQSCQLYQHLADWMGKERQYCEVRRLFVKRATDEADPHCFAVSLNDTRHCGRHSDMKGDTSDDSKSAPFQPERSSEAPPCQS